MGFPLLATYDNGQQHHAMWELPLQTKRVYLVHLNFRTLGLYMFLHYKVLKRNCIIEEFEGSNDVLEYDYNVGQYQ